MGSDGFNDKLESTTGNGDADAGHACGNHTPERQGVDLHLHLRAPARALPAISRCHNRRPDYRWRIVSPFMEPPRPEAVDDDFLDATIRLLTGSALSGPPGRLSARQRQWVTPTVHF
jgi:hypothetical protein